MPQTSEGPVLFYSLRSRNDSRQQTRGLYLQDTYCFLFHCRNTYLNRRAYEAVIGTGTKNSFSARVLPALIPAFNEKFTLRVAAGVYHQALF